jgi:hypothetical protein
MGTPLAPPAGIAKDVTWPQCGPTACWTPFSTGIPFCEIMCAIWSGCQRSGSTIAMSDPETTSGGFTGV